MNNRPPSRVQIRMPGQAAGPHDRRRLWVLAAGALIALLLAGLLGFWLGRPGGELGDTLEGAQQQRHPMPAPASASPWTAQEESEQKQPLELKDKAQQAIN
mgnify:CR=1 FL=1